MKTTLEAFVWKRPGVSFIVQNAILPSWHPAEVLVHLMHGDFLYIVPIATQVGPYAENAKSKKST
jgi:hypothetical protein